MASSDSWKWSVSIKQSSSRLRTGQFVNCCCCISSSFCVKTLHCSISQQLLVVNVTGFFYCYRYRMMPAMSSTGGAPIIIGGMAVGFESSKRHSVYFPWHQFHKFFSTPLPLSIRGWAGGTKGTLIHPLCSLPTLSRSIVNSSQCGEGDFHTRTRRAISVGWVVLEKKRLDGCWVVCWLEDCCPPEKIKLWLFWCRLAPIEKRLRSA